jgi:hypothetical protein
MCLDSYEAEKLSSIFSKQRDDTLFLCEIAKVIGSEAVVRLKDGSHHSIMFKDEKNALELLFFFRNLTLNNGIISDSRYTEDKVVVLWYCPLN